MLRTGFLYDSCANRIERGSEKLSLIKNPRPNSANPEILQFEQRRRSEGIEAGASAWDEAGAER